MQISYDISKQLRILRTDAGLNQAELGRIIGVDRSSINLWESGKRSPQMVYVKKLCEYFDVDMNYLLGYSETKHTVIKGTEIKLYVDKKLSSQSIVVPNEMVKHGTNYRAEMTSNSKTVTIYNEASKTPCMVLTNLY